MEGAVPIKKMLNVKQISLTNSESFFSTSSQVSKILVSPNERKICKALVNRFILKRKKLLLLQNSIMLYVPSRQPKLIGSSGVIGL